VIGQVRNNDIGFEYLSQNGGVNNIRTFSIRRNSFESRLLTCWFDN
jgi:hypothetical protein